MLSLDAYPLIRLNHRRSTIVLTSIRLFKARETSTYPTQFTHLNSRFNNPTTIEGTRIMLSFRVTTNPMLNQTMATLLNYQASTTSSTCLPQKTTNQIACKHLAWLKRLTTRTSCRHSEFRPVSPLARRHSTTECKQSLRNR